SIFLRKEAEVKSNTIYGSRSFLEVEGGDDCGSKFEAESGSRSKDMMDVCEVKVVADSDLREGLYVKGFIQGVSYLLEARHY
ncbi:hypothetical protein C5167_016720, partial [Papaver somniferum]